MIEVRDFEDMVDDTCQRIVDSGVGITNIGYNSVTRTIIEAIMSELDIVQYKLMQAYLSKTIDEAEGEDLDDVVSILGVVRKQATNCTGVVTFSVTEESDVDIDIPAESTVSTVQTQGGVVYEFLTIDDAVLKAGDNEVDVEVVCNTAGDIYIPANSITIINTSIIGIAEVTNKGVISGGTNTETDEELRDRTKNILTSLGKGTTEAIRLAVQDVDGVTDVSVYDMRSGVGTVDVFVVTDTMPVSDEVESNILKAIEDSKSGGIKAYLLYPDVKYIDVDCMIESDIEYDVNSIYGLISEFINSNGIGNKLILNQLEKTILGAIDDDRADVTFNTPSSNVQVDVNEVLGVNSIKINGVIYYERNN